MPKKLLLTPIVISFLFTLASLSPTQMDSKDSEEEVCADCALNSTCLVVCRQNENGSETPICSNYGQQSCACEAPVFL